MGKILVTGAAGLVGLALTERMAAEGYEFISCDVRYRNNPVDFSSEQAKKLVQECDGIIHLASISRVIHAEQYPLLCHAINVNATLNFLQFCSELPEDIRPWVIFGSSKEVYGQQTTLPVNENASFQPINEYARARVEIEEYINKSQLNYTILRFANIYGGLYDHYNRVVPALCISALKKAPVYLEGENCIFDFVHVDDVVNAILQAVISMQNGRFLNTAINIGNGIGYSLHELAELVFTATENRVFVYQLVPRDFDIQRFVANIDKAKNLLGWEPHYSLKEGIKRFIGDIKRTSVICPYDLDSTLYKHIKSYSWLPALLQ